MAQLNNRVAERRRTEVLQAISSGPKTLEDLQKELGASYMTVYRTIQPMLEEGLIEEAPWRTGHKKSYCATSLAKGDGKIVQVILPNGNRTLAELISRQFSDEAKSGVQGALSQIWRFCTFTRQPEQLHLAGSMSPGEVKPHLRELLGFYKNMQLVLEQILLADIWTDSEETAEKFGPVDVPVALEQGEAFEKRHGR